MKKKTILKENVAEKRNKLYLDRTGCQNTQERREQYLLVVHTTRSPQKNQDLHDELSSYPNAFNFFFLYKNPKHSILFFLKPRSQKK